MKAGFVTWRLSAADVRSALQTSGHSCTSPHFAIPPASLPPACKALLAQHHWRLACILGGQNGALAVALEVSGLEGSRPALGGSNAPTEEP